MFFQYAYSQLAPIKYWSVRGNAGTSSDAHFLGTTDSQSLFLKTDGVEAMQLGIGGTAGIGFSNFSCTGCSGYRLFVKGGVKAEKIKLNIASDNDWADYVLRSDYQLLRLEEVEKYIQEKGNLPNIPSAEEVAKNGIELGEMKARLLAKIEELTLYTIDLNKRNEDLTQQSSELDNQITNQNEITDKLQKRIEKLEHDYR
ncbi:hypothetical protein DRF57_18150 [Chryseobacterium rhizosphaerae]|uniref:Uncharacterized protein n=2 Tax=Chryseobacterium rhizosphaerae TaxID=395937 RepID=A0ABX9IGF5_9FLAO|nr:hypothetical protein DRF57_18150 [Chryseobacterium rhizosphaerae]GEN67726.1 hypothetical protein CRH01_22940 [Chryseobacterium rhizosphaerae]